MLFLCDPLESACDVILTTGQLIMYTYSYRHTYRIDMTPPTVNQELRMVRLNIVALKSFISLRHAF